MVNNQVEVEERKKVEVKVEVEGKKNCLKISSCIILKVLLQYRRSTHL